MKNLLLLLIALLAYSHCNAQTPCVRIVTVIPSQDQVTIKNFDSDPIDVSLWYVCSLFSCDTIQDEEIISGDFMLEPGDSLEFIFPGLTDNAGDLGIYNADNILDPNVMVDFMQYGASASFGNEATAVMKGIWEEDDFIDDFEPYIFFGTNCDENGVDWWQSPNGIIEASLEETVSIQVYSGRLHIDYQGNANAQLLMYSATGQLLLNEQILSMSNESYELSSLTHGIYILRIANDVGLVEKKILVSP